MWHEPLHHSQSESQKYSHQSSYWQDSDWYYFVVKKPRIQMLLDDQKNNELTKELTFYLPGRQAKAELQPDSITYMIWC